jgi:hypothetical protein
MGSGLLRNFSFSTLDSSDSLLLLADDEARGTGQAGQAQGQTQGQARPTARLVGGRASAVGLTVPNLNDLETHFVSLLCAGVTDVDLGNG